MNRTVDEMGYMLKCGFRQIHVIDDGFTIDLQRAKNICEEIIKRRLRFPWTLFNGIRVDNLDYDLLIKLKQAGCWQIGLGIESGSQELLDKVKKGTSLAQVRLAVRLAKKAGLETFGFFMLGLPGETERTLRQTIRFSIELGLDIAKYDFTIPYPDTPLYEQWQEAGYIISTDWRKYICHRVPAEVYKHPNLPWDILRKYYYKAYRAFYLRPAFILKRFIKGIINGTLLTDIGFLLQTKW